MLSTNYKTSKFQLKYKYGIYVKLCCVLVCILSLIALLQVFYPSTNDKNAPKSDNRRDSSRNRVGNSNYSNQVESNELRDQNRGNEVVDHKYVYSNAIIPGEPINSIEPALLDRTSTDESRKAFSVVRNSGSSDSLLRARRNVGTGIEESKSNNEIVDQYVSNNEPIQVEADNVIPHGDYSRIINNTEIAPSNGVSDIVISDRENINESGEKSLVSVTSKSGIFDPAVLPLDDLIVSPATEAQVESNIVDQHPPISSDSEIGNHQQESLENQAGVSFARQPTPNLAELAALGTATGVLLGDLAAQQATSSNLYNPYEGEENSRFAHNLALQNAYARDEIPQSYNPYQPGAQNSVGFNPENSNYVQQPKQDLEDSSENSPDSMESLMRTDDEDMGVQNNQEDPAERSSSNLVQDENVGNFNEPPSNIHDTNDSDDDDDDDGSSSNEKQNNQQMMIPQNMPFMGYPLPVAGRQFEQSLYPQPFLNGEQQLIVPMRESMNDLNTAAGHYYGKKKKKKKVVVKKKKKKIKKKVVKKKKKKKVVKYKVKVKKVKKKKKPAEKHHDHGKYYM